MHWDEIVRSELPWLDLTWKSEGEYGNVSHHAIVVGSCATPPKNPVQVASLTGPVAVGPPNDADLQMGDKPRRAEATRLPAPGPSAKAGSQAQPPPAQGRG